MRIHEEVKIPLMPMNSLILATNAVITGNDQGLKAMFESKRQRTASMSSRLGTFFWLVFWNETLSFVQVLLNVIVHFNIETKN